MAEKSSSTTDETQDIREEEMVPVQHKSSIFMLMMSKDDNLLLQMGGFISSVIDARFLTPELKAKVPELFLRNVESESSSDTG